MPRTTEKLEKILFYLFLFLIPFQLRMTISWNGNEWNSYFLYFTDLLLVGVFILAIVNTRLKGLKFKKSDLFLILFFVFAFISLFKSIDLGNSVYRLIKLAEFIGLYIYIGTKLKTQNSNLKTDGILSVIFYSGVLQAILAIFQFYKQSSLGLKFIEAGTYLPGAPGVATFIMNGEKIMRPYGSFPHPNVLSVFLLLAVFCFYALWLSGKSGKKYCSLFFAFCYLLLVFALFLTSSRGTILVFIFVSFGFLLFRFFQLRVLYHTEERLLAGRKTMVLTLIFVFAFLISTVITLPYLKARFFTLSLQEEAIDMRFFYNKMAISTIKEKPLLGVGMGNFVDWSHKYQAYSRAATKIMESAGEKIEKIPEWIYQPVHNIYLLVASEIGIFGALVFVLFLVIIFFKSIWPIKPKEVADVAGPIIFLFLGFLILALSDHYFWTLQSGGIMFWLSLALMQNANLKMQNLSAPQRMQEENLK